MEFLRKTTWLEKILFLAALAVFCISVTGVVLFNRFFGKPFIDPADIIARVTFVSNTVKRHTPFQFEFVEIEQNDPIGNGDTIFSGSRSKVLITFNEGSVLTIGADSLVVIRIRDGKIEVKIDRGDISGKIRDKTEIEVQSDEESILLTGLKNTEFELSYLPRVGIEIK